MTTGPVKPAERISILDIVRGFAIFGILLINVQFYSHPVRTIFHLRGGTLSESDYYVILVTSFLISEKFFSILALLFGIGMAITFDRTRSRHGRFVPLYARRLIGLFAIGISHALLFYAGDYIGNYALLGLLALAFCYFKPAWILPAGLAVLLVPVIMSAPAILQQPAANPQVQVEQLKEQETMLRERTRRYNERSVRAYGHGSLSEIFRYRFRETISQYWSLLYVGWKLLAMILLGIWCWKTGIVKALADNLDVIRKAMWISLVVGLAGNALSLYGAVAPPGGSPALDLLALAGQEIGAPALGVFYVTAIVTMYYSGVWLSFWQLFAPVGRMAMSNYVFQSVVCTTLFYAYGLGLYYKTSYAVNVLLAFALFSLQLWLSRLWFKKYAYGPLEYLLRVVMYGRIHPAKPHAAGSGEPLSEIPK